MTETMDGLSERLRMMAQGIAQLQQHRQELEARLGPASGGVSNTLVASPAASELPSGNGETAAVRPGVPDRPVSDRPVSDRPVPDRAVPDRPIPDRAVLIDQLVTLLGRQFGWRRDATLDNKLTLLLRDMRLEDVRDWVLELQGPGLPGVYPHELLKGVTVNETYFHRDRDQLEFLRQEALPALVAAKAARGQFRLSLWSAGCSTGEEVYTLAMIVLDVLAQRPECASFEGESGGTGPVIINMGPWSVDLLGTDIRSDVLDHARRAEYEDFGLGPFRSLPENQSRFFLPVQRRKEVSRDSKPRGLLTSSPSPENGAVASNGAGSRWLRVAPEITRLTRFQTHNLLEPPPIYGCDLVSCRNVMIYFDEEAKKRTQRNLYAALGEGGLLLLGPTDTVVEPGLFAPESPRTSPVMRKLLPPLSPLRSEGGRRGG